MIHTEFVDGFDDAEAGVGFPGSDCVVVPANVASPNHLLLGQLKFRFCCRVVVVGVDVDPVERMVWGGGKGFSGEISDDADPSGLDFASERGFDFKKLFCRESTAAPGVDQDQFIGLADVEDLPREFAFVDAAFHDPAASGEPTEHFKPIGHQLCVVQ